MTDGEQREDVDAVPTGNPRLEPALARVLGCLIEKSLTTPDSYPLSLNSLRLACNQSTNRDPVVSYDDATVETALGGLRDLQLARRIKNPGERVIKHKHVAPETLQLSISELAVICVQLLRGPQTPGELKQRTERMHDFGGLDEIEATLQSLAGRDLVRRLERRPGQKESRWATTLVESTASSVAPAVAVDLADAPDLRADDDDEPAVLDIVDVRSGAVLRSLATDGEHEVHAKVGRAIAALPDWTSRTQDHRIEIALEFAARLANNAPQLGEALSRERGADLDALRHEVERGSDDLVSRLGADLPTPTLVTRFGIRPGVIGIVTDRLVGPAEFVIAIGETIATGSAIVLKPSRHATLFALEVMEHLHAAGVPADVAQAVVGGPSAALNLARSAIDGLRFFGSHGAGTAVVRVAGERSLAVEASLRASV